MKGGHIRLTFSSSFSILQLSIEEDHDKLSNFWETIVLSLIGETLDEGDFITGARVIDKSNPYKKQVSHRVEIWFREWTNEDFKNDLQKRVEKLVEDCNMTIKDLSFSQNDFSKWQK